MAVLNDDCFWLADIWMPNGSRERLDSDILPAGWTRLSSANWTGGIDPVHAHGHDSICMEVWSHC